MIIFNLLMTVDNTKNTEKKKKAVTTVTKHIEKYLTLSVPFRLWIPLVRGQPHGFSFSIQHDSLRSPAEWRYIPHGKILDCRISNTSNKHWLRLHRFTKRVITRLILNWKKCSLWRARITLGNSKANSFSQFLTMSILLVLSAQK